MAHVLTIVIVDDDPPLTESLADLLRLEGHEVLTAYDGQEALHIADPERVHLVLADLRMPVMGGDGLCAAWRQRGGPAYWFALMSSLPERVARERVSGIDAFLAKPFQPDQLFALVAACASDPKIATRFTDSH